MCKTTFLNYLVPGKPNCHRMFRRGLRLAAPLSAPSTSLCFSWFECFRPVGKKRPKTMSQFLAHILVRKLASKRSKRLVDGVRAKLSPFSPRFTKREVRVQQERAASARSRLLLSDDSHPSRTYVKAFGISKKRCFEQALHDTTVIMRVTFVPMCALAQRVGPFCAHFWCAFWPKMGPKTGPVFGTRIATQKWDQTFQNVLFVHPGGNQIRCQKQAPVWGQKLTPPARFC